MSGSGGPVNRRHRRNFMTKISPGVGKLPGQMEKKGSTSLREKYSTMCEVFKEVEVGERRKRARHHELGRYGSSEVDIVHFVPDERKSGGGYQSVTGSIKTISLPERMIILNSGQVIHFDDILDITGTVFSKMPEE